MRLAVGIVVLHIVQRREGHLYSDVESFVSGVRDRGAKCNRGYVWFAVLFELIRYEYICGYWYEGRRG